MTHVRARVAAALIEADTTDLACYISGELNANLVRVRVRIRRRTGRRVRSKHGHRAGAAEPGVGLKHDVNPEIAASRYDVGEVARPECHHSVTAAGRARGY